MPRDVYDKLKADLRRVERGAALVTQVDNAGAQHVQDPTDFFRPAFEGSGEPDGTFTVFDPESQDDELMDAVEQEAIALSSPPMKWFRIDRDRTVVDRVTGESQVRIYREPVVVVGSYEQPKVDQMLGRFGIEEAEEIEVVFNLNYLLRRSGAKERPYEGDVVQTHDGKLWEVMDAVIDGDMNWRRGHCRCALKRVRGEGYKLPGISVPDGVTRLTDISDSPLKGSKDGHHPKGSGRDGVGGSQEEDH